MQEFNIFIPISIIIIVGGATYLGHVKSIAQVYMDSSCVYLYFNRRQLALKGLQVPCHLSGNYGFRCRRNKN
jgi:hypothetical protein